jgi:hypothetical protein
MVGPMLVPELKIPVAVDRSLVGNHSATALIAAGMLPASPSPRKKRAMPNPVTAPESTPREPTQWAEARPGMWRSEARKAATVCSA